MRHVRVVSAAPPVLLALALTLAACGGGDDEAPSRGTTSPSPGGLPPSLVECFADEGFDIESGDEIHSAPPQVVEQCFDALHQGGGSG